MGYGCVAGDLPQAHPFLVLWCHGFSKLVFVGVIAAQWIDCAASSPKPGPAPPKAWGISCLL